MINVWAGNDKREAIIRRKLLTDKSFKLTSLQVNPLYKPVFDKLDAQAVKILNELDKSVLWSRKYTKTEFKYTFAYPFVAFAIIIFACIHYGVRYRLYYNYIKHGRKLGMSENMDIDLDDVESYPASVLEFYKEKKKYDAFLKTKEEKMNKVEDSFHKFAEKRIIDVKERRKKRGLKVKSEED
eukprot:CAMPEP_0116874446 /NCGR_PEP_ID=MMETSP0463-20121206/5891_1 /TAXON_ID=181622 /ORGANISM="Strombidinopsis sp, Strain SopsisLIS2011" /LENGTH=182 /DNA_ID=CAMNT_0004518065 /DNA_START=20 /DNA_END=568 /DNA_ORIENTATION=+